MPIIARRILLAAGAGIVELESLKAIAASDFSPDIEPNAVAIETPARRA